MRIEKTFITQTIQPRSWNLTSETENNKKLLLSVYDSLNRLYATLIRLNNAVERKIMEQNHKG